MGNNNVLDHASSESLFGSSDVLSHTHADFVNGSRDVVNNTGFPYDYGGHDLVVGSSDVVLRGANDALFGRNLSIVDESRQVYIALYSNTLLPNATALGATLQACSAQRCAPCVLF